MTTPDNPAGNGSDDDQNNPFKGTPFEALFGGLGGALGGAGGQMPDLNALMAQMQNMMSQTSDGSVNWDLALDTARKTVAASPDPSVDQRARDRVADAVRLADHWLDDTTDFTSGVIATAAWSRAEWLVETMPVWRRLAEPIAQHSTESLAGILPEEMKAMAGPLLGMLSGAMGTMVTTQIGSGLGTLANDMLGSTDIGLPLGPAGRAALLPANVAAFADGLDVSEDDVMLYLALREAAHHRLFGGVDWLREHLLGAVADYANGMEINVSGMEEKLNGFNMSDPAALQEAMQGGMFEVEDSPAQKAALERLEVTLALIEGWVDDVVSQATEHRMPAAAKLAEQMRRRRAAGGPAEQTFATLVGLELRPRRLREAATLWGSLRSRQGTEGRDGVWMSPHLLPTSADLDDPLGFREDAVTLDESVTGLSETDFEAELRNLLDGPNDSSGEDPGTDSGNDPTPGA